MTTIVDYGTERRKLNRLEELIRESYDGEHIVNKYILKNKEELAGWKEETTTIIIEDTEDETLFNCYINNTWIKGYIFEDANKVVHIVPTSNNINPW